MFDGLAIKQQEYFYLCDGRVLTNLKELAMALSEMNEGTFNHHVTSDRNDFANWVLHVFHEPELAAKILDSKSKFEMSSSIEQRLNEEQRTDKLPELGIPDVVPEVREQKAIEGKIEPVRKFDFREKMEQSFSTIGEAFSANKIDEIDSKAKKKYSGRKNIQLVSENDLVIVSNVRKKKPAKGLVKAYPFEKTTARSFSKNKEKSEKSELIEKNKEILGKIDEILVKEKELEVREKKILEVEERLEKELKDLAQKKEPKFFSKEFVHGLLIGLLVALIVGLIYVKFFG